LQIKNLGISDLALRERSVLMKSYATASNLSDSESQEAKLSEYVKKSSLRENSQILT